MNCTIRTKPKPAALPDYWASLVRRIDSQGFYIVGLPADVEEPNFRDRQEAEVWLAERLPDLQTQQRRGPRACLTCKTTFISDGLHNRRCNTCRGMD